MPLTRELGKFIAELRYPDIPREALSVIKTGFADSIGVMLAGAHEKAPQLVNSMLAPAGGEASVLFGQGRTAARDAAWINSTAAHVLDFDDVALRGHPSAVLVPTILAQAEVTGASGKDMLVAYAAGYETWAELVGRDADQHQNKGWHPTGIFGSIAAAAACASLRRLNAEKSATAIALGASQSAGLVSNFGSMAKPFHAGRAAHAGIVSAWLAESDFTASLDALEHPPGFLTAVSPAGKIDPDAAIQAGVDWVILRDRLAIKKYPLCGCVHRALDGILDLLQRTKVNIEAVRTITASTGRRCATVLRNHSPHTGLEAKFSMEFAMACAVIAGRAQLSELTDEFVLRRDIQSLMKRVKMIPDDREDRAGYALFDRVTIELTDGEILDTGPLTKVRGGPDVPLTDEELWLKFDNCLQIGKARMLARKLFDSLMSLDRLREVAQLPGLADKSHANR